MVDSARRENGRMYAQGEINKLSGQKPCIRVMRQELDWCRFDNYDED